MLALPPFYYKGVSDDGLFRFFAELIERVGDDRLRLFLYHIPPMAQVGFSPELIGRLLDAYPGMIAGTKDSAGDAARIERDLQGVPAADGVRRLRALPARHAALGRRRLHLGHRQRHRRARPASLRPAGRPAGEDADAEQAALTEARGFLEGFPLIPALKAIMREQTGDDVWRNLRPPLDALDERVFESCWPACRRT